MSTVEAGGIQGDKVSAIQKRHMVESDTLEGKRHSRLSRIVKRAAPATMTTSGLEVLEKSCSGEDVGTYLETRKVFR